jgi:hypothetical protein
MAITLARPTQRIELDNSGFVELYPGEPLALIVGYPNYGSIAVDLTLAEARWLLHTLAMAVSLDTPPQSD